MIELALMASESSPAHKELARGRVLLDGVFIVIGDIDITLPVECKRCGMISRYMPVREKRSCKREGIDAIHSLDGQVDVALPITGDAGRFGIRLKVPFSEQ